MKHVIHKLSGELALLLRDTRGGYGHILLLKNGGEVCKGHGPAWPVTNKEYLKEFHGTEWKYGWWFATDPKSLYYEAEMENE